MWEEISRLSAEQGMTILLTTHYLEEADQLAARLAIVDRGRVVAEGTPDELKSELRGDAIHVELADAAANGRVRGRRWPSSTGVREVAVEGRSLRARADDGGARGARRAPGARGPRASRWPSVTVARPSLDDVYLRYAGRTFDAAEAEAAEVTR